MTDHTFTDHLATWHKSGHSGQQGTCVEVARLPGNTLLGVRDTAQRSRGHIGLPRQAWQRFLTEART